MPIHYMIKKSHAVVYLCNQAYHINSEKATVIKGRVTCKNCLRKLIRKKKDVKE